MSEPRPMTDEEYQKWMIDLKKNGRKKMLIEELSEAVHMAYCNYQKEVIGKEYWTKGDYSKLTDEAKEADRYTVRAVLDLLSQKGLLR